MIRITSTCLHPSVQPERTLVMLVNLGSSETLSTRGVRDFLKEFLSDPRVINITRWLWLPILYGFILPRRPVKLVDKYKSVWLTRSNIQNYIKNVESEEVNEENKMNEKSKECLKELLEQWEQQESLCHNNHLSTYSQMNRLLTSKGMSQLTYETHMLAHKLQVKINEQYSHVSVVAAMRYGSMDSITSVLSKFYLDGTNRKQANKHCTMSNQCHSCNYNRLIVLPLFPQYSSSTSASVFDAVMQFFTPAHRRYIPHVHFIRGYAHNATYITSITQNIITALCEHYNRLNKREQERLIQWESSSTDEHVKEENNLDSNFYYDVNCPQSLTKLGARLTRLKQQNNNTNNNNANNNNSDILENEEIAIICSYHSLPVEYVQEGDDYDLQCRHTTQCVIEELNKLLQCNIEELVLHVYQSKFGNAVWLEPLLVEAVKCLPTECNENLKINNGSRKNNVHLISTTNKQKMSFAHKAGNVHFAHKCVKTCFVVAPGFAADCLETVEEIGQEAKEIFIEHGGKNLYYIPALNHTDAHVETILSVLEKESVLQKKKIDDSYLSQTSHMDSPVSQVILNRSGKQEEYATSFNLPRVQGEVSAATIMSNVSDSISSASSSTATTTTTTKETTSL